MSKPLSDSESNSSDSEDPLSSIQWMMDPLPHSIIELINYLEKIVDFLSFKSLISKDFEENIYLSFEKLLARLGILSISEDLVQHKRSTLIYILSSSKIHLRVTPSLLTFISMSLMGFQTLVLMLNIFSIIFRSVKLF